MKIFVGNLPFDASAEDVKKLFEGFGSVAAVDIVEDSDGKSRGFGFVEMDSEDESQAAIAALNEQEFMGRVLNVAVARERGPSRGAPHGKGRRSRSFQRRQEQAMREPEREEGFTPWEKRHERGQGRPWGGERRESARPWGRGGRYGESGEKRREHGESNVRSDRDSRERFPARRERAYGESGREDRFTPREGSGRRGRQARPWERDRREAGKPWGRGERQGKPWEKHAERGEAKVWSRGRGEGAQPRKEGGHGGKPWQNRPRPHKSGFRRRER